MARTYTTTHTVYRFDELSEDAQQKALESLWSINVDHEWWEPCCEEFHEKLDKIGIECTTFYFDIDRGAYLYLDNPSVVDSARFMMACGIDGRTKAARDAREFGIRIETHRYGGGSAANFVYSDGWDGETDQRATEFLQDVLADFHSHLRKEYDYQTSEETIRETIEANGYEFTENGEVA